ncbi:MULTISPECIES: alpha-amylase family glycosyl hydrolase [Chryseobacterium]|uniref:Cyclomaltodextrinase n=1 Tax=Chryseobacterium camelliae TaxID=1265445 RepID=A0ABU0TNM4_9FLAO|nr:MULTISPECIES: alpha-amylase family glycosyl hydrolase [Chryseobacterium]MDT3407494.1 cyclomaltodextrinase [Pseudacidovorax intermedius]MDQ1098653.1 cyclomaltodextrinase [Chryseobacterium camelliae]MDQ1102578.1 cyclomaltodextrinase [Chryseobacterium sp. SORGH_AS_1048]MDR6086011.1 cyclomaltodextrinase [Chryseobacterium sp. SORGH_AS_0909]MDR6130378.1 cyclomaltodextrinase [Chryseobacterium sp. SORGH_AS_1175]
MKNILLLIIFTMFSGGVHAQENDVRYQPKPYVEIRHPEWSKNATIYEVNIRQYTPEGTFKAFEKHLPRLKKMGVDIIWLMPVHPIGELNRKGKLGSYYSVKDFKGINPDFGSLDDFKNLVRKIHSMGMHVIIDWVGNHSAWDNPLTKEHPDWYTKTREGKFQPTPWYDWDDVIDFDYNNPAFRKYMTDALKYWVSETDIDGFRCDVAGFIPVDFWENARTELDQLKPVFMLAEWESRDLYKKSFDMTYSWTLWDKLKLATVEKKGAPALFEYMAHDVNSFPYDSYRMTFTDNHDKNSWEGNQFSNFGNGLEAAMVLCSTVNGMPLVYSGQEAGLDRSLAFFDKDPIGWKEHRFAGIYETLFKLKHSNQALWNGRWGGEMERVHNDNMNNILSFYREKNGDAVMTIINFSDKDAEVKLDTQYFKNTYKELFSGTPYMISENKTPMKLKAWEYRVLVKTK